MKKNTGKPNLYSQKDGYKLTKKKANYYIRGHNLTLTKEKNLSFITKFLQKLMHFA